jgi:DNA-binding NarL/FixJ family response regulator
VGEDGAGAAVAATPAESMAALANLVRTWQPHVLLLDMLLPQFDSVEAIRVVGEQTEETNVLAFSSIVDDNLFLTALRAGAIGYITTAADLAEVLAAIRTVGGGAAYVPPPLAHHLVHHFSNGSNHIGSRAQRLTPREREVLTLVGEGCSNRKIAQLLNISPATVRIHVRHTQKKLALNTRMELALFGAQFILP